MDKLNIFFADTDRVIEVEPDICLLLSEAAPLFRVDGWAIIALYTKEHAINYLIRQPDDTYSYLGSDNKSHHEVSGDTPVWGQLNWVIVVAIEDAKRKYGK